VRTGDPWLLHWDPAPFGHVLTPLPTSAFLDFTNPEAYAWWRDAHAALFDVGVDVMKTDFGEQIPDDPNCVAWNGDRGPRLHNVYPLLYNRCAWEASARRFGQGLVFGRSAWTGSQRCPVQWGGDPQTDWGGLAGSIRGMLSWAASGTPYYATDIGGFYGDQPDAELFVRWCQAAVFASHMRFHGIGSREPWSFGEATLAHLRAALELRYRLIPYIEAALAETCATGLPLTRPMALAFPEAREAHTFDTQYLFGPDLLVCPILRPGGRVTVWLPEGVWWDWFTDERHVGPRRLELALPLERFPLFARDGAAIPLAAPVERTDDWAGAPTVAEVRRFG
jgi:alpha-D-xyloside xylohydrolase